MSNGVKSSEDTRRGPFRFLDGGRGTLEEFPGKFSLEAQTGFCGALFTGAWFGLYYRFFTNSPLAILFGIGIAVLFLLLAWASVSANTYFSSVIEELKSNPSEESENQKKTSVRSARLLIAFLSGSYVVVCSVLIWITGGATSPFIPFYVMIFTLTISKNKITRPGIGWWILLYFLIAIVVACMLAAVSPTPIDKVDMRQIELQVTIQVILYLLFICASLIVPTVSAYLAERTEMKRVRKASLVGNKQ